ncbi:MAG: hypothetical protein M1313_00015 [Nitrospirae bacterium]|jgi:hypothetical protein|nr:hypothetical protein [Nitrospirota bacterium]
MLRAYRIDLKSDSTTAPSKDRNGPGDLASDKKAVKMLVAEVAKDRRLLSTDIKGLSDSDDASASTLKSERSAIKTLRSKLSSAVKSLRIARADLRRDETGRHATPKSSSHGGSGTHPVVHHADRK